MISDNILKWYTDEIEEEKPKKRGRKAKNQNRDEE